MKAVITVNGPDRVGIIASVSAVCRDYGVNIEDISQTLMQGFFTMSMFVNLADMSGDFSAFKAAVIASVPELTVHVMNTEAFEAMHRI